MLQSSYQAGYNQGSLDSQYGQTAAPFVFGFEKGYEQAAIDLEEFLAAEAEYQEVIMGPPEGPGAMYPPSLQ